MANRSLIRAADIRALPEEHRPHPLPQGFADVRIGVRDHLQPRLRQGASRKRLGTTFSWALSQRERRTALKLALEGECINRSIVDSGSNEALPNVRTPPSVAKSVVQ